MSWSMCQWYQIILQKSWDTPQSRILITWCVSTASTCTWTTTEEHRFRAPWSFLMRLSTIERWGAFAIEDSSMHTECLQYCNKFLSHSAKSTNGKPTVTHGYAHNWGHFGTLPHHLPQDNCLFSKCSRSVALHQKVLKKRGASSLTSDQRSEVTVIVKLPSSCWPLPAAQLFLPYTRP